MITTTSLGTVIVLGGSIAGLLAAAAAAPYARRVVVVDRDALPDTPGPRPGAPQTPHPHALLASGREAVEWLLPGTTADLIALGAPSGDAGLGAHYYIGGHHIAQTRMGTQAIAVSRAGVEAYIRGRIRGLANVTVLDRTDALGLLSTRPQTVTGVRLRDRTDATAREEQLGADLVIDATGRPGRASRWFGELGWPSAPEERVVVGVRYATTHVPHQEGDLDGARAVISGATPATPRGGVAIRQEDGTWIIAIGGYAETEPPTDPAGYHAFSRGLVAPGIAELLGSREALHEPLVYRFPHCVRRRIEDIELPGGYAVLGDAISSFDPTFGQGMTVAAQQTRKLAESFAGLDQHGLEDVLDRYHQAAAGLVDSVWKLVTGAVLEIPGVTGDTPPRPPEATAYLRQVQQTAAHDEDVARALLRVSNLFDPPTALMQPAVMQRVMQASSV